jgi:hypothetical protein
MEDIIGKLSLFIIIFTSILMVLFFLIDLGLFGDEVQITGLYYLFMAGFLGSSLWIYRNKARFKGF